MAALKKSPRTPICIMHVVLLFIPSPAPLFEKVEGAYWFWACPSIRPLGIRSRTVRDKILKFYIEPMQWPHLKILGHGEDKKGARRRGRQKKRWENDIKEWTEMGFGGSLRAAEDREGWKGIVATSSVVPRRPPRLRD